MNASPRPRRSLRAAMVSMSRFVELPERGYIRIEAIRDAVKQLENALAGEVVLVVANADRSEWQIVTQKETANRQMLRRMVIRREGFRTVIEQLDELARAIDAGADLRDALDKAYNVEPVRKRFFTQYAAVFDATMDALGTKIADKETRKLFCQRLFNRLLFVRFLEKRGWLRLRPGDERTDYLRTLWRAYTADRHDNDNFYRDRLCPLFFDGLNTDHPVDYVHPQVGIVPYLNGGLFDPEEDDRNANVVIPDGVFAAICGDGGAHEGLLYQFNFTVTEATPLDVEVAVDPEMLGKVFEELVTVRHESGSYYTPKPIVAFMGREALKGYLRARAPHESPQAIARFVDEHKPEDLAHGEAVLDALKRVRICDPACGSGAYLLGMLHELLDLRQCLFNTRGLDPLADYDRKLAIIQNNLYGVDIDPFATGVARLRLWLSLIVDFTGDVPPPLPNLDYKIGTSDSLIAPLNVVGTQSIFLQQEVAELYDLKAAYISEHGSEKRAKKQRIDALRARIGAEMHGGARVPGFDWRMEFEEVFRDGGFDIVLANPPYIRQEVVLQQFGKEYKENLVKAYPAVGSGTADFYIYFYARALQLLRPGGMLAFISPNKWFRAAYGAKLRAHIAETCDVGSITDFGELPVFETAATFPMIFVARKGKSATKPNAAFAQVPEWKEPYDVRALMNTYGATLPPDALNGANWTLTDVATATRLRTMTAAGIPLGEYVHGRIYYGIKTGFNDAFYLKGVEKDALIAQDPRSADLIKPLAVGDDIRKWTIRDKDRWMIVTPIGVNITQYPAIFAHLSQWQAALEKRWDKGKHWWELRPCDYYPAFAQPKIVFPDIARESRFAFNSDGDFINNTTYFIPSNDVYLLGILNSSAVWGFCKEKQTVIGDANNGGRLRFFRQFVEHIPIPQASETTRNAIADLVQHCLDAKGVNCGEWEREIDARVAALYGL